MSIKVRNYVFTLNNYTELELGNLISAMQSEANEKPKYIYLCFGFEVSESGTPHLQGYVELANARAMNALKKDPGFQRAHIEPRGPRSSKIDAVTYCAKNLIWDVYITEVLLKNQNADGTLFDPESSTEIKTEIRENPETRELEIIPIMDETVCLKWGRNPVNIDIWRGYIKDHQHMFYEAGDWDHGLTMGRRNDIFIAKEIIAKGGDMREVIETVNSDQAIRVAQKYLSVIPLKKRNPVTVVWLWGPTGSGKTLYATKKAEALGLEAWISPPCSELKFFQGYIGQKFVIFDDFRGNKCKLNNLLQLLDTYSIRVEVKGGDVPWVPEHIYITSPRHPRETYVNCGEDIDQLLRRINGGIIEVPRDNKKAVASKEFVLVNGELAEREPYKPPKFVSINKLNKKLKEFEKNGDRDFGKPFYN